MTKRYNKHFSQKGFWRKIYYLPTTYKELSYRAKLLYYLLRSPGVPVALKASVVGALGYLICPLDAIPDTIPIVGYVDDIGVITATLGLLEPYITTDMRQKAAR